MKKNIKFLIKRYDPAIERSDAESFDEIIHEIDDSETVLFGLIEIQRSKLPDLSMRFSCRSAVCGSCSMKINGRPRLACKTRINELTEGFVKIEPLPNLPVVKDLVVDLEPFFANYRSMKPYFMPKKKPPKDLEERQSKEDADKVRDASDCIMCSTCVNACPVLEKKGHTGFKGPAPLLWAYRFIGDSRDGNLVERLSGIAGADGVNECDQFAECHNACPKNINPSEAIRKLRMQLLLHPFIKK